jgi:methyl-accepting chemotaxis protein
MKKFRNNSLVTNFTVIILLILVVGQGILYTWLLLYQKMYLEERLREEATATAQHVSEMIGSPGVTEDRALDEFLEVLLKEGLVTKVTVTDSSGKKLLSKGQTEDSGSSERGLLNPYRIFYVPSANTVDVPLGVGAGKVEVVYSGQSVNELMKRFLFVPPFMQGVTFLVVVYAIIKFFRKKVSDPVRDINSSLARITAGDLTVKMPETADKEIGSIVKGLRFLVESLSSTIARSNSLSGNVAAAMDQLTVTLNSLSERAKKQSRSIDRVVSMIREVNNSQKKTTENTDKLSRVSSENVASLLEMKAAAEEIATSTGRLFKSTGDSYAMIAELSQTAKGIADSSGEVFRAVDNTATSVEQISVSLNEVRENTKKSSDLSAKVRQLLTDRGTLAVADAIEAMEKIVEEVNYSAKIISQLEERSKDIEKILSVIKEVTEKTNLLSLNAAILAAQAGEYGKGFSVVADEIRSLSDKTSSSARDIASIVKSIQTEIHGAVDAISHGVTKVEEGKDLILKSGEAMGETLEAAQKSAQMARLVERATGEQAEGLRQIRLSMDNVKLMIEQVVKATEEEKRGTSHMLESISDVKEVAELMKKATEEHAVGTNVISENLELSTEMASQINQAAGNHLKVNENVVSAVENMRSTGVSSVSDMEEVTLSFGTLRNEVESLKKEMEAFKTEESDKSGGGEGN